MELQIDKNKKTINGPGTLNNIHNCKEVTKLSPGGGGGDDLGRGIQPFLNPGCK